jgi:hypothetical protein
MFHIFLIRPFLEILTSTIGTKDESKGRLVRKAKVAYDFLINFLHSSHFFSFPSEFKIQMCKINDTILMTCVLSFRFQIEILLCKSENFNSIMSSKKSDRPKSAEEEIKV